MLITVGLNIKQALDADAKVMQQIKFTGYLKRAVNTTMFFIIEEVKENILNFSQETIVNLFYEFI